MPATSDPDISYSGPDRCRFLNSTSPHRDVIYLTIPDPDMQKDVSLSLINVLGEAGDVDSSDSKAPISLAEYSMTACQALGGGDRVRPK